jgi:trk system potassium uptake protein TrkA
MKRFAVIGLGQFGQKLAVSLSAAGADVIAVDREKTIIDQLRDQVSHAVRLDAIDEAALKSQGINKVDVAIVTFGQYSQSFETAILTIVSLKTLGVKYVIARALSPLQGKVFLKVGADEIIYPEIETAQRWAYKLIAPQVGEKIDFAPGYSLARIKAPASFDLKTLIELQLRQRYNINLVAIKRSERAKGQEGEIINVPMPNTTIYQGDILMVAGSDTDIASLPTE